MTQRTMTGHLTMALVALVSGALIALLAEAQVQRQENPQIAANQAQQSISKSQLQQQQQQQQQVAPISAATDSRSLAGPLKSNSRQLAREWVSLGSEAPKDWIKVPLVNGIPMCRGDCVTFNGEMYQLPAAQPADSGQRLTMTQVLPSGQIPLGAMPAPTNRNPENELDDSEDDGADDDAKLAGQPKGSPQPAAPLNNGQPAATVASESKPTPKPKEESSLARILKGFGGGMLG